MKDLVETIGRLALSFQAAPTGASARIWDELRPWLARLAVNAAPKWLPNLSFGFPCSVPVYQHGVYRGPCDGASVAACDVCSHPCCLAHARIDQFGDAICFRCVVEAIERKKTPAAGPEVAPGAAGPSGEAPRAKHAPPTPDEVAWAKEELGVKKRASWEEIQKARRKLLSEWHPDRFATSGAEAKAKAEAKFKDVEKAFGILTEVRERKEAA